MHQKYESYPDQFTPADLTEAYEYVQFCLAHEMVIDFDAVYPELEADLYIVKAIMLSYYD
jgi:hypothetical protein